MQVKLREVHRHHAGQAEGSTSGLEHWSMEWSNDETGEKLELRRSLRTLCIALQGSEPRTAGFMLTELTSGPNNSLHRSAQDKNI